MWEGGPGSFKRAGMFSRNGNVKRLLQGLARGVLPHVAAAGGRGRRYAAGLADHPGVVAAERADTRPTRHDRCGRERERLERRRRGGARDRGARVERAAITEELGLE